MYIVYTHVASSTYFAAAAQVGSIVPGGPSLVDRADTPLYKRTTFCAIRCIKQNFLTLLRRSGRVVVRRYVARHWRIV